MQVVVNTQNKKLCLHAKKHYNTTKSVPRINKMTRIVSWISPVKNTGSKIDTIGKHWRQTGD